MINTLHLGLSYGCNMNCSHCFVDKTNDKLSIDQIKEVIDYLDTKGLFFVIYTFGEPLLSKKIWEVAKYISSKNIVQILMTNGSLVRSETIKKLREVNIQNIYVSLDSIHAEKHDRNRQFNGAYDKAVNALKLLQQNGFNVGVAVTINDSNVEEMKDFVNLCKSLNVKNLSFLRQRKNGQILHLKHEKKYISFYINYLKKYKKYNINLQFHDINLILPTMKLYRDKFIDRNIYEKYIDMNSCHYSTTISLEPNGNVKHCNLIHNTIGNLNDYKLNYLLNKGEKKYECINDYAKLS